MWVAEPTVYERGVAFLKRLWRPKHPVEHPLTTEELSELYCSQMFERGNLFHRHIIHRTAPLVHLDETHLEELQHKATQGTLLYLTVNLGQLEYNVLNHVCHSQNLPLAHFNNALRIRRWLPLKQILQSYRERIDLLKQQKRFPHPLRSGYLKTLLKEGKSAFLSLDDIDPTYLSRPSRDLLNTLLDAQRESKKPIFIVPTQLVWDKRPRREGASLREALFGETERPGRWRKLVLFFRHFRNRAVVKFAQPISLQTLLSEAKEEAASKLFQKFLGSLQLERRILTGPPVRQSDWFIDRIFEEKGMSKILYEVSKERGKAIDSVKQLARKYAKEIAPDLHYSLIELSAACLSWTFRNLFDKLIVDPEGINRLKRTLSKGPTILTPNHRSHMDAFLIAYLCYQHDIVVPYVAAGINMAFWPVGSFFKKSGVFFLRRTFAGNKLYKAVFQTYLKVLIQEGYLQNFFIEGGRSRTGKLRSPKMGMLSMYSEVMHEEAAPDIQFMPMSITYDRVMEQSTYAKEVRGGKKIGEKARDLFKLGRYFGRRYGNIYINFDEPISWQEVAKEITEPDWDRQKPKIVSNLAQKITHAINRQVVVIPQALAASVLLTTPTKGMGRERASQLFQKLLHYLRWKQAPLAATLIHNPERAFLQAIHQFEQSGFIKKHQGLEEIFYEIPLEKRLELDYFKNTTLHYLVSLALLANLLLAQKHQKISLDTLVESYAYFQQLLHYEFRFSTRLPIKQHLDKLCCYLQEQKGIDYHDHQITLLPEGETLLQDYSHLIRSFIESYLVAWKTYLLKPIDPNDVKALSKAMLAHGKHQLMLGHIQYAEAVSQATFENAIQSFKGLGLFSQESNLSQKLEALLEQLLKAI